MRSAHLLPLAIWVAVASGAGLPIRQAAASEAVAAARPAQATAADVVLQAADVGPDYVLSGSVENVRYGGTMRTNSIVRSTRHTSYVEKDGILGLRSVSLVTNESDRADQAFELISREYLAGTEEVPVDQIGDRSRGGRFWGQGPFSTSTKVIVFRAGNVVGVVISASYEAPSGMDDLASLAQIMVSRAGR